jgi:hypothetical protein
MAAEALRFPEARPAEGLLASHKDEAYCNQLSEQLITACSSVLDAQRAQAWKPVLRTSAALLYHGLTTGRGQQTPGEEYCDLTLVRSADDLPAPRTHRGIAVALHVLVPHVVNRICAKLIAAAQRQDESGHWLITAAAPRLKELVEGCERVHRAMYLLRGRFLYLSHRIASLHQVPALQSSMYKRASWPAIPRPLVTFALPLRIDWRRCVTRLCRHPRARTPSSGSCSSFSLVFLLLPICDALG